MNDLTDTSELWLPVVGYEGSYEVSSFGRVRSLARTVAGRWGSQRRMGVLFALHPANKRYLKVTLQCDGVGIQYQVHSLVLEAFIGPCPEGFQADHVDFNIANNVLTNLRWISQQDNLRRRRSMKLTHDMVDGIRSKRAAGVPRKEVAETYGVGEAHINQVTSGRRWSKP